MNEENIKRLKKLPYANWQLVKAVLVELAEENEALRERVETLEFDRAAARSEDDLADYQPDDNNVGIDGEDFEIVTDDALGAVETGEA